jgi:TRAP-type C4-dicarboxylate transport system permease small subunit
MHRLILTLARGMAVAGGAVLAGIVLLISASVAGRSLNGLLHGEVMQAHAPGLAAWLLGLGIGPVNGDFELVQAGMAFAIFAFLPLCQVTSGHAVVDVFTAWLPPRGQRLLRAGIEVLFAAVLVVIAVQLYDGTLSKLRSGQQTFLLQMPVWWSYAASLAGAAVAALVGVWMALVRLAEATTGRDLVPDGSGAVH